MNVRHHTGSEKNQTPVLGLIRKIPSIHEGQRTCDTDRKCNVIYYNPAATLLSVKACWLSHDVQNRSREMLSFFLSFQNMYSELVTVSKQSIKLSRTQCKPTLLHCHGNYKKNGSPKWPETWNSGNRVLQHNNATRHPIVRVNLWLRTKWLSFQTQFYKAMWHILFPKMKNSINPLNTELNPTAICWHY